MKSALIEDRLERLEEYADQRLKSIENLTIFSKDNFDKLKAELINDITVSLDAFDCVMCHRSAFDIEQRELLKSYCKERKIPLIFFSGSISSSTYYDLEYPLLYMNSMEFYSSNILLFLEDLNDCTKPNLLIMQFGSQWKLNQLLNIRRTINYKFQKGKLKRVRDLDFNQWIIEEMKNNYELDYLKDPMEEVSAEQIRAILSKLNLFINDIL